MNKELLKALSDICEEKGIERDVILDALEAALVAAYKRNFNSAQNVEVQLNRKTGVVKVVAKKEVVEVSEDFMEQTEISLEDAKNINGSYTIGDIVDIEVTPKNFGRIAAMTAKQVITQRLREAERDVLYSEYTKLANEIISGKIARMERGNLYIDIGKMEAVMPANEIPVTEQPISEHFEIHQRVSGYISEVKNGNKGMQIILSRTHPGLVRKLFEREVPEIQDGIVEIKNIAREAGSRTKIAVYSEDKDVDAQGSCIGPKGMRVQNIGDELGEEKIDIIKWSENPAEYIAASLSPSSVISVEVNEEEKTASVTVPEYQLSLAIGKAGQNVRLAARLTGWKIDIVTQKEN